MGITSEADSSQGAVARTASVHIRQGSQLPSLPCGANSRVG